VRLWDTSTGQEILKVGKPGNTVLALAFSPDGSRIASGLGMTVQIRDLLTGQEVLALSGHAVSVSSIAFSPDGSRIATAGEDRMVRVWDAMTGQETLSFRRQDGTFFDLKFSPDGSHLACAGSTASNTGDFTIWNGRPLEVDREMTSTTPR
jgi:WD40 repeat protein